MQTIKNILKISLNCHENDILSIKKLGGMTNQNYLVKIAKNRESKAYCLRMTNLDTNKLICRNDEKLNDALASEANFSVKTIFFDEKSGVKITKFLEDSICFTHENIADEAILKQIASQLKALHKSKLLFKNIFNVFDIYDEYDALLGDKTLFYKFHDKMGDILKAFELIRCYLNASDIALCPCHNDLVPENILLKEKLYFIDWEYSGLNDPLFEIANFFIESRLDEKMQDFFLQCYFGRKTTAEEQKRLKFYAFSCDVLWTLWTAVKEQNGEFYDDYGFKRAKRAYESLKNLKLE